MPDPLTLPRSRSRARAAFAIAAWAVTATLSSGAAAGAPVDADLAGRLARLGFENVGVDPSVPPAVGFENRRWLHSTEALGRIHREAGSPLPAFERRLGLASARIVLTEEPGPPRLAISPADTAGGALASAVLSTLDQSVRRRFEVAHPADPGFGSPPAAALSPTRRKLDLELAPLLDYELGRVYEPVLYRLSLQAMLRWNPWPGGQARAALVIPVHDDFETDPSHPDVDRVRPGPLALDQFAWLPWAGLASASGGYFGDNRYGFSGGLARPFFQGALLLDAQADFTGYVAFLDEVEYSSPEHWTAFAGASVRPGRDLSVRARVARFLQADDGVELEVRRSFGDLDLAVFAQRTSGDDPLGLRVTLPVPPFTRSTRHRLRVAPLERFRLDYHSRSEPVGRYLAGVPSREDFLRQLDAPALNANLDRYLRARGDGPSPAAPPPALVSLAGMTGFVNTPWAGVMPDRAFEVGFSHVPSRWAWDHRGQHDNQVWYATLGFFPRVEVAARLTVLPGLKTFSDVVPGSRLTDTDYMASGRLVLFEPGLWRPGVALGVEDAKGTRRFHSTYGVAGTSLAIQGVHGRVAMGYAFDALSTLQRSLDGAFGAVEASPWRRVAVQLEYDSEKWNVGLAVAAPFGVRIRAAFLNVESLSLGAGWSWSL